MISLDIDINGIPQVLAKLSTVEGQLKPDEIEPILLNGAQTIADAVRGRAPIGPTGNLRRGVVAKLLQRRGDHAAALTAMNYRIAPHAHFLEAGTKNMSARPFFGPGVASVRESVIEQIIEDISRKIQ